VYVNTGVYPEAPNYSHPTIQFGLYTSYGNGTMAANGQIQPFHVNQPVWAIIFTNVPDSPSGGGYAAGQVPASLGPPRTEIHDIVTLVDAENGQPLGTLSSIPDSTPFPPRTGA
jgi:hypothetical protein